MKNPNADIDRAIASVIDDVPPERVSNWCAHIQTRQVGVSFLGQQVGLPIGPKEIACTKTGGSIQAQTYRGAAETFVSMNCIGCDLRVPVSDDNICAQLLDDGKAAAARQASADTEQRVATDAARALAEPTSNLETLLAEDPVTDVQIRGLIAGLADPDRQREAAKRLERAAARWPELFSERAAQVMCGMIRDPGCGDLVLAAARHLSRHLPVIRSQVISTASDILRQGWMGALPHEAARTISDALTAHDLVDLAPDVVDALIRYRGALVRPPWLDMMGSGEHGPTAFDEALDVVFEVAPQLALGQIGALLRAPQPHDRAAAANTVARFVEHSDAVEDEVVTILVDGLIAALALSDDDEDADPSVKVALSMCRKAWPTTTTRRILAALPQLPLEASKLAVHSLHINTRHGETQPPAAELIPALNHPGLPLELRAELADTLSDIGHDDPEPLWISFNELLAALVLVADERARVLDARPSGDTKVTTEQFYDLEFQSLRSRTLLQKTQSAVATAALWGGDGGIAALSSMLKATATGVGAHLKVAILEILGEIGEKAPDCAPELVPLVYLHILDLESHSVRGAAVRALAELTRYSRNVLPDDVLLLVAELFNDRYLHPVISGAVGVFERAHVGDRALATRVMRALALLYMAYEKDPAETSLMRSITDAQLNLTQQHSDFLPLTIRSLSLMSKNEYYYTATDVVRDLGYLARWHEEAQAPFVASLIDFYRRFSLEIALEGQYLGPGQSDGEFGTLYELPAHAIREHASPLIDLARDGVSHRNPEFVATLLLACAAPEAKAAFELSAARLPDEGQYEWRRERALAIATLLTAEELVVAGQLDQADDQFWAAEKHCRAGAAPTSRLPFGLGDLPQDPGQFTPWTHLRREWLKLPEKPTEVGPALLALRECIDALPEAVTERDASARSIATALVDGLDKFRQHHVAVRAADPAAQALRAAALARFQDASEEAAALVNEGRIQPAVAEHAAAVLSVAQALGNSASVAAVVAALRRVPLPVPIGDLPTPRSWRTEGSKSRPWREREKPSQPAPSATPMARVSIQVNRVHVAAILDVAARQIYDVEIAIELDEIPVGCSELIVKRVSRLPPTDYHFPEARLPIQPGVTRYTVTGTLRFDYAQSDGSQPIEVKLLVRAVENVSEHDVDLVGTPAIQVRVGDAAAAVPATRPRLHEAASRPVPTGAFPPPLHLSCHRDGARHEVLVDSIPVLLTDQNFVLLLRLVRARLEDGDGWLQIERPGGDGLVEAGFLSAEPDQAINRLRVEFTSAIRPHKPTELIVRSRGQLRLATPGDLVTWDEGRLMAITDQVIAAEARAVFAIRADRS